ncbi:MAG: A/G-specific adenine glycosylase [Candidatus Dormibacteria bacterium]
MHAHGLHAWYLANGRHELPWRRTREPWAVLVSEVMLQQTSAARVGSRWAAFLQRWPTPGALAAARAADLLRQWQGLGYPRRALALQRCATHITEYGWPESEAELRALPGIGPYTARALLCLCAGAEVAPADVNIARVAARAVLGAERATAREIDGAVGALREPGVTMRDHVLALFDVGATLCQSRRVACGECPIAPTCRSRHRLVRGVPSRPRKQAAYSGSRRQLRGALLRVLLEMDADAASLRQRLGVVGEYWSDKEIAAAVGGLRDEGFPGADRYDAAS